MAKQPSSSSECESNTENEIRIASRAAVTSSGSALHVAPGWSTLLQVDHFYVPNGVSGWSCGVPVSQRGRKNRSPEGYRLPEKGLVTPDELPSVLKRYLAESGDTEEAIASQIGVNHHTLRRWFR